VTPSQIAPVVVSQIPSATCSAYHVDAVGAAEPSAAVAALDDALSLGSSSLVVGCGLGISPHAQALTYRALQLQHTCVVFDADALRAIAAMRTEAREVRCTAVLTPHPGEFAPIADMLAIEFDAQDQSAAARARAAELAAQKLGCIVVLKGHASVVTDGHDTWVCDAGHACMATAGSGDVLAGLLGAILAARHEALNRSQPRAAASGLAPDELEHLRVLALAKLGKSVGVSASEGSWQRTQMPATANVPSLLACVRAGVLAHAKAGEAWARDARASAGMLATELADAIPRLLEELREHP
jgi:NAD(P)H-hydrate epimerase